MLFVGNHQAEIRRRDLEDVYYRYGNVIRVTKKKNKHFALLNLSGMKKLVKRLMQVSMVNWS